MPDIFKPMLAATVTDPVALSFPLLASPKLDGVRCVVRGGVAYSRSNKPIRNRHIQKVIAEHAVALHGLDGELIVGDPTAHDVYRVTNSAVSRIEGEPDFTFYVFDNCLRGSGKFIIEFEQVEKRQLPPFVSVVPQTWVSNPDILAEYEERILNAGYEGVMLRGAEAPYKQNRSTLNEAYLMKLKRFSDAEALCIGFGELMHNQNEAKTNELGHTDRSSAKDGLVAGNTLGYLLCKTSDGIEFKIGTGYTAADRDELWQQREDLIGRVVKYKFFNVGIKEAPRHPVWLGFRNPDDL